MTIGVPFAAWRPGFPGLNLMLRDVSASWAIMTWVAPVSGAHCSRKGVAPGAASHNANEGVC